MFIMLVVIRIAYYIVRMIESFKDKATETLWMTGKSKQFGSFKKVALRKLDMLQAAVKLDDLRSPPANHLEALKADRKGQHSIRINDQFRICFVWTATGPADVEITDYH